MPSIDVAFFQQSFSDVATKINGDSITPVTLTQLIADHPNVFFTAFDDNNVEDLCAHIPSGTTMTIEVNLAGGGTATLTSNIFVGTIPNKKPPTRPS